MTTPIIMTTPTLTYPKHNPILSLTIPPGHSEVLYTRPFHRIPSMIDQLLTLPNVGWDLTLHHPGVWNIDPNRQYYICSEGGAMGTISNLTLPPDLYDHP